MSSDTMIGNTITFDSNFSTKKDYMESSWPECAPSEEEEHIVSIVCGNSHLHWAFHNGVKTDVQPALFWRYVRTYE